MQKNSTIKSVDVVYEDRGEGACIVLLHGYLETREIWRFCRALLDRFRVLTPIFPVMDSREPGERCTPWMIWPELGHAMLEAENIEKVFLVGHSMGGYVTMAFAELFPEILLGIPCFTPPVLPILRRRRKNRDREISLVLCR